MLCGVSCAHSPSAPRMRVVVNAGGLLSGGGNTIVHALLDELSEGGDRGVDWVFIVAESVIEDRDPAEELPARLVPQGASPVRRIAWEQLALGRLERNGIPHVLVSAANFGPLVRSRRHVLMLHNRLHFDRPHLRGRRGLRLRVESALAHASVRRATVTVTSSTEMSRLVEAATGRKSRLLLLGPGRVRRHVPGPPGRFTFVHRTEWGAHKRFAELLRAIREVALTDRGRFVVISACDPRTAFARRFPESRRDRELLLDPVIAEHVRLEAFGTAGQTTLHGDAVVMPSTTEAFCLPLAEAVGVAIPVVAADTSFARELCGPAAFYAPPSDHRAFARGMRRLIHGERPPPTPAKLRTRLSWGTYIDELIEICRTVATEPPSGHSRKAGELEGSCLLSDRLLPP
jgi:glycosyltransferase involved in cell wall biosynthesis